MPSLRRIVERPPVAADAAVRYAAGMELHVETEVGALFVTDTGQSPATPQAGPAVFFWPSLYTDGETFARVVAALAPERRCIVVDGPGHGRSAAPPAPYDLRACARAAMQVLDARGIDVVDWVGNAWGGHTGVRVAVDFPARVRSLAVISSPMEPLAPKMRRQLRIAATILRFGGAGVVAGILEKKMLSPSAPPEHRAYLRACITGFSRRGLLQAIECVSIARPDLRPELARVACPTLFLVGGDGSINAPEVARAQAAQVPGAHFEVVARASHLPPLEQPDEVVAHLRTHFARVGR